jgi:hypothetical protein
MRKILLIILSSVFFYSIAVAQLEENGPDTWDFGRIRAMDGIVKHTFLLENDSDENLNINGTHASCGCAVSEIDREVILPKETASLEVKFNPKGYFGQVTQFVYVNTDSKTRPVYKFIIKADIIKD